jgi:transposase
LSAKELVSRLVSALEVNSRLRGVIETQAAQMEMLNGRLETAQRQTAALVRRVEQLERQIGKDSSNSGKPPSSDSPFTKKKPKDRSLRDKTGRRPGKRPGGPGSMMKLVDDPDESHRCPPAVCSCCAVDLGGALVTAERRHQITEITAAVPPKVIEYLLQVKHCGRCGTISGQRPNPKIERHRIRCLPGSTEY